MSEENQQLMCILEGAIFAAGEPLSVHKLQALFEKKEMPEKEHVIEALNEIKANYEGRGVGLIEVASGWRFQVRENIATWVNRLWDEKPQKYSRALIETLALIAYRQPITRGDIEEVRGVAVSSHIIKTLAEREWVKVIGHRDVPGRPALYATTKGFLDYFNLKSLDELPTLGELKDIDSLNQNLEFGEVVAVPVESHVDQDSEDEHDQQASAESEEPDADLADSSDNSEGAYSDDTDSDDINSDDINSNHSEEDESTGEDVYEDASAEDEEDLDDTVGDDTLEVTDENDISDTDTSDVFENEIEEDTDENSADNDTPQDDQADSDDGEGDTLENDETESAETESAESKSVEPAKSIVQTTGSSMFDSEPENNSDNEPALSNDDAVLDDSNDENRDALDE